MEALSQVSKFKTQSFAWENASLLHFEHVCSLWNYTWTLFLELLSHGLLIIFFSASSLRLFAFMVIMVLLHKL